MKKHLDTYQVEVETALRVYYAYAAIRKLLSEPENREIANRNVYFWKIFISSVQTKLFISLGRLYDYKSKDSFSLHKFLELCKENFHEFDKATIEKIKLKDTDVRPDWLDDYLLNCHCAAPEDIKNIEAMAEPFDEKFKGTYKIIRSRIFAHAIFTDTEEINLMLKQTNMDEIEEALTALWSIYNQVWQLYVNGQKPTFKIPEYPYKKEVEDSVRMALLGE